MLVERTKQLHVPMAASDVAVTKGNRNIVLELAAA